MPDHQLFNMCDASEHGASYVLLIEGNTTKSEEQTNEREPVVFRSRRFTIEQMLLKMSTKEFLAMHFAFKDFRVVLWAVKKPQG